MSRCWAAGITGLSSAYYIRTISPRKRVVVLEAKGCGNGASGRNGAMVLTITDDRYINLSPDPAVDKRIHDLTAQNIQALFKLSVVTGIDCELETNGALQVLTPTRKSKPRRDTYRRQDQWACRLSSGARNGLPVQSELGSTKGHSSTPMADISIR